MKKIKYDPNNLGSFEKEWLIHKKCKEWWYATGVLFDKNKNMYSYQYTMLSLNFKIITLYVGMIALTDYKNNKHYYKQNTSISKKSIIVNEKEATYKNVCNCKKEDKGINIRLCHKDFDLDLFLDYGKGAVYHCDNGKLQMGIKGEKETTFYYSYPNMKTSGILKINGKTLNLTGKSWFDKQGGTYSISNTKTHWEWFSLRFFDDEEMMLFTFPQDHYVDGTYIKKDGTHKRLDHYIMNATKVITFNDALWSSKWELKLFDNEIKNKDKFYKIEPIQEGHINFAYFEELCYIKNENDEIVGYCFSELLPGVRNKNMDKLSNLFKNVEF